MQTRNVDLDILKKRSFKPSEKDDDVFIESYKVFCKNPFNLTHAQLIWRDHTRMRKTYNDLHIKFDDDMAAAETLRASVDTNIGVASKQFVKLLSTSNVKEIRNIVVRLQPIANKVIEEQKQLLGKLENMGETIELYNVKRYRWAEYLIGMRDTLNSDERHSVTPVEIKLDRCWSCPMLEDMSTHSIERFSSCCKFGMQKYPIMYISIRSFQSFNCSKENKEQSNSSQTFRKSFIAFYH